MYPRVQKVSPLENYKILVCFTNGEQGIYDCKELLNFGVFKELRDKAYFEKIKVHSGTIQWPNEQDICPDTLYIDSLKVA